MHTLTTAFSLSLPYSNLPCLERLIVSAGLALLCNYWYNGIKVYILSTRGVHWHHAVPNPVSLYLDNHQVGPVTKLAHYYEDEDST